MRAPESAEVGAVLRCGSCSLRRKGQGSVRLAGAQPSDRPRLWGVATDADCACATARYGWNPARGGAHCCSYHCAAEAPVFFSGGRCFLISARCPPNEGILRSSAPPQPWPGVRLQGAEGTRCVIFWSTGV